MKQILVYIIILTFMVLQFIGCGGKATQHKSNSASSSLVVTYNGKEVHRRNTGWVSDKQLQSIIADGKEKIVIFGAPWCKSCALLRKALPQANLTIDVYFINVDEEWGQRLASVLSVREIPLMLRLASNGDITMVKSGAGTITVYLLATF